jgi:hypothetical protein
VYAGGYSESGSAGRSNRRRSSYDDDSSFEFTGDIGEDLKNAAIAGASKFLGRAIGRKVQKTVQDRVVPAMQAKAAQAQQRQQESRTDQAAIAQRYPYLRGCVRDQVLFLEGGSKTVPIGQLRLPATLAGADALVSQLRSP